MKRLWLVAAAVAPLSFAAALPTRAHAQTTISNSSTTPVFTSTTGNLTITGSIQPGASGNVTAPLAAVTIDSSNSVTNQGTISFSGHDYTVGVQGNATPGGTTALITNSGTITDSESTTGGGTNQNIANGPFANGTDRFGIRIVGPGTFNGVVDANDGNVTNVIDNTGAITIVGNNSAGISIEAGVNGGIFDSGTITVTGGNATTSSYGIHSTSTSPIGGNVTIKGAITATGQNATGVSLEDGLTGRLLLQNTITATGYRSTSATNDPKVLDKLTPDQILQGGPGLAIGGDVGQGVVIDVFRAGNTTVAANTGGSVIVYGSAPALLIGGVNPLTVGVGNGTYGLDIGGSVAGIGDYAGFNGNGIQIGGNNTGIVPVSGVLAGDAFGAVTIDGGINISGNVAASSVSIASLTGAFQDAGNATAIGLHLGAGASTPTAVISGSLGATSAGSAGTSPTAVALEIDAGANMPSLVNSGNISAIVTGVNAINNTAASGGTLGTAYAIEDKSGTLTSVTNTGLISASIIPINGIQTVDLGHSVIVAIDLHNSTAPVTVTQMVDPNNVNGVTNPAIVGAVVFGNTDATLNLIGGSLKGDLLFGNSTNNSLAIGNATSAATLTGALVTGDLSQYVGGAVNIAVNNGELFNTYAGNITVPTLTVGTEGGNTTATVIFSANPVGNTSGQFYVTGNATLGSQTQIGLNLLSKLTGNATFDVIQTAATGNLTTTGLDTTKVINTGLLPYLYDASLVVDPGGVGGAGGNVSIAVSQKKPTELGLNKAEAGAYAAIFANFDKPDIAGNLTGIVSGGVGTIKDAFLSADTRAAFIHLYDQMLPDYGGGVFETLTQGQQGLSRAEADAPTKLQTNTTRGWVQEIGYATSENSSANGNGFLGQGFGIAGGVEAARGDSAVGVAAAFLSAAVNDGGSSSASSLGGQAAEVGVYMRAGGPEGFKINADVNGGVAWFNSNRTIVQESLSTTTTAASTNPTTGAVTPAKTTTTDTVSLWRQAHSHWFGAVMSADLGLSYQKDLGKRLYVRPGVSFNYSMMYEAAHKETGGGQAFDLSLNSRLSTQATVEADMVIGAHLGDAVHWQPEMTIGWRQIVTGGPGNTKGRFTADSNPLDTFSLNSSFDQKSGVVGRVGVHAGGAYADFSADAGGVFGNNYQTYDARAVARFLF